MQINAFLSSVITYDDVSPLLFHDETKGKIDNLHPLSRSQSFLLDTFQGLSKVSVMDFLNNNQSVKKLS